MAQSALGSIAGERASVFFWPEPFKNALANGDTTAAGTELLRLNLGLKLVPAEFVREGDSLLKRPIPSLAPTSPRRDQPRYAVTDDPIEWRQWLALCPDALLGIVPGDRFLVVDDDHGGFDPSWAGIAGTYADRSPRPGIHHWVQVPPGHRARFAKLPTGGELITGSRYVVSAPSLGYAVVDPDAPVMTLPASSPLWRLMRPIDEVNFADIPIITDAHRDKAGRVITKLVAAPHPIGTDVRDLLAGKIPGGGSLSEADYRLALLASYWTSDAATIAAVLWASRLARKKWRRPDYLPRTIGRALARRQELAARSVGRNCELWDTPPPHAETITVTDALIFFLMQHQSDKFARLPVQQLANWCGVNRKTITRTIERLELRGDIETNSSVEWINGRPRCTRWARLKAVVIPDRARQEEFSCAA
jgi:hypothetical protein